jgi:SpoU rRNA methylase family enzyme
MVRLVEGTVFPAVSFGPISHALCRLVPSSNRTVASYSARALKLLILDDALRSQAIVAGVPAVVCGAIKQWEDEVLCLRELLGALQTLTWDKVFVRTDLMTHDSFYRPA